MEAQRTQHRSPEKNTRERALPGPDLIGNVRPGGRRSDKLS